MSKAREGITAKIHNPSHRWERFDGLRQLYREIDQDKWNPYPVDWNRLFTNIERAVWGDIKAFGLRMWPQYPVGRRFVDFGDPEKKIAIECDGANWHSADSDLERDEELAALGWSVFRIPGSDCVRTVEPEWDLHGEHLDVGLIDGIPNDVRRWLHQTSEGFVSCLAAVCYGMAIYHPCISMTAAIDAVASRASDATPFEWSRLRRLANYSRGDYV